MAQFNSEKTALANEEGLYAKDPSDPGGETVWGCTRKDNPDPELWALVDAWKKKPGFPKNMAADSEIWDRCAMIFKARYWDYLNLDACPSQTVASKLLEISVNQGKGAAVIYLKSALNSLNKNQDAAYWPDQPVDGEVTPELQAALTKCLAKPSGDAALWISLLALQVGKYLRLNEKFEWGWLLRRSIHLHDAETEIILRELDA